MKASDTFTGTVEVTAANSLNQWQGALFTVTRDITAPVVSVSTPARVTTGTIPVLWSATDALAGPSGVYTVSVMTDTGPLQLWLSSVTSTTANFTGELGHTYTFVVTATDNVSNAGQSSATTYAVQATKYYYIGSSRVAMRRSTSTGSEVTYLHTDHLGTVSIATDASGQVLARTLNMPYGSVRWSSGVMPTDWGYTGQKEAIGTGLVYLHARYYASWPGRFVSADTVVPEPGNPQALNRFAYVRNNPIRRIDPSGHVDCSKLGVQEDVRACGAAKARPFESGRFLYSQRYGWFDQAHFPAGNQVGTIRDVLNAIDSGGDVVKIEGGIRGGFFYRRSYSISGAAEDPIGVALGIYMDWSVAFEGWEGDFPFYVLSTSSFSMEDLPSHYLGFVAAARGFDSNNMAPFFAYYADVLGPIEPTTEGPPQAAMPNLCGGLGCNVWYGPIAQALKNHEFTPKVQGTNGQRVNVQWPSELTISPVSSAPNTWQFMGEEHNRLDPLQYARFLLSLIRP